LREIYLLANNFSLEIIAPEKAVPVEGNSSSLPLAINPNHSMALTCVKKDLTF
jgi:hypothetical protein